MCDRSLSLAVTSGLALALLTVSAGCGGSDSPTESDSPPQHGLSGDWEWSIADAKGANAVCSVDNVKLNFSEAGGVLTGSVTAGGGNNINCVIGGSQHTSNSFAGTTDLLELSRTSNSIAFTFDASAGPWVSTGTITGPNTMAGTATIRLLFTGGTVATFTGPWKATRS